METINYKNDLNSEFGIDFGAGDETPQQGAAFPPAVAVPQSLPSPPVNRPTPGPNPWPPQLIMDLSLNIDTEGDILERHMLTPRDLENLYTIPQFRREVAFLMRELRDTGITFSRKAAMQAEEYLSTIHESMMSVDTPASTRLAIFAKLATLGKLDPVKDKEEGTTAPQVSVQINLG